MHTKRYKGDKRHVWPAKILAPAVGGRLCCMAVRRLYEHLNPVPVGTDPSRVPYWQLADGSAVTRERLQQFIQSHMSILGLDASVYKTHSLRKGGVTAMLAAGVSLPQIQLMARWSSPSGPLSRARSGASGCWTIWCVVARLGGWSVACVWLIMRPGRTTWVLIWNWKLQLVLSLGRGIKSERRNNTSQGTSRSVSRAVDSGSLTMCLCSPRMVSLWNRFP